MASLASLAFKRNTFYRSVRDVNCNNNVIVTIPQTQPECHGHHFTNSRVHRKTCPPPRRGFVERESITQHMLRYFRSKRDRRIYILYGLGGAGKSQIAYQMAKLSRELQLFSDVYYVDGTSATTIEMDLQAVARAYTVGENFLHAIGWLEQKEDDWLLVIDGADDPEIDIHRFIPNSPSANILITTRNRQCANKLCDADGSHEVSSMSHDEARQLLLPFLEDLPDVTHELVSQIVKEVYCFPLSIVHAGYYIRNTKNPREFLATYQTFYDDWSKLSPKLDGYNRSIYATLDLSYSNLSPEAQSFIDICSFLHHEGIPGTLFRSASVSMLVIDDAMVYDIVRGFLNRFMSEGVWNPILFQLTVDKLQQYSLVNVDNQGVLYSFHPLVQQFSRTKTKKSNSRLQQAALALVAMAASPVDSEESRSLHRLLYPHIACAPVTTYMECLGPAAGLRLSTVLQSTGHFRDARSILELVLDLNKKRAGSHDIDPLNLTAMYYMAWILRNLGEYNDAEKLAENVLTLREKTLGSEHLDTLAAMNNFARTLRRLGRYREAKGLEDKVLEQHKKLLGPYHPDTLTTMNNLASILLKLGEYQRARGLQEDVLNLRRQVLGHRHPDTLTTMHYLGVTLYELGEYESAMNLQQKVLDLRREVLGPDHPETLSIKFNLAKTLRKLESYKQALQLNQEVLEIIRNPHILGPDHPDTLMTMHNLALVHYDLHKYFTAWELQEEVLQLRIQRLGRFHPDTLTTMNYLAQTLCRLGRYEEARKYQDTVLSLRMQEFGPHNPQTLHVMETLSYTLYTEQDFDRAADLLNDAVKLSITVLGPHHPDTLRRERAKQRMADKKKLPCTPPLLSPTSSFLSLLPQEPTEIPAAEFVKEPPWKSFMRNLNQQFYWKRFRRRNKSRSGVK